VVVPAISFDEEPSQFFLWFNPQDGAGIFLLELGTWFPLRPVMDLRCLEQGTVLRLKIGDTIRPSAALRTRAYLPD